MIGIGKVREVWPGGVVGGSDSGRPRSHRAGAPPHQEPPTGMHTPEGTPRNAPPLHRHNRPRRRHRHSRPCLKHYEMEWERQLSLGPTGNNQDKMAG